MNLPDNAHPFVGRRSEIAVLRAELATVRAGRPRLVLVEGSAGIGKSAVLDRFLSEESELTVLRATGEQWEAFVAFGVVDQLMRTAGVSNSRFLVCRDLSLPAEEPVGVGARILEVLEDLEQKAPVVIVIDDAHWADVDSLRALLFVVRRLVGERVLTLLAQRSEAAARLPEGLRRMAAGRTGTTIRLPALPAEEITSLATALGVQRLSARVARQLHAHTEGNPLYITTLLSEMPEERWRTWEPVLPAPSAFAMRVVGRLDACGPAARRLVEAAAVLGGTTSLATAAALAEVAHAVEALDEAVDLNLLQLRDDTGIRGVTFSHPLVQAAVYEQLGPARRVRLHSGAAGLVDDEASALRHRVMAVTPPDPELVTDLDAFARRQSAVGAWAGAAWALVEGSRLSPDRRHREQRLLRAVDAMAGAGDLIQAETFAREAVAFAPGRATPRSATSPSFAGSPSRPNACSVRPGITLTTRATRRCARWWRSGGPCTPSGGCGVRTWWTGRSEPWTWHRRPIRCGSRHRRCSGRASAGRGGCRRASRRTTRSSTASPTTRRGRRSNACTWPEAGSSWSRTTWCAHTSSWPRRPPPRSTTAMCASRSGRTCGWPVPVSRSVPGTRRPRTRSGRCRCWRSPGTAGCASWRGSRR